MLTGEMTPTAIVNFRRQAILGMAHYRSGSALAVNPALKGAPLAGCGD
jgi:hypothetical protein